MATRAEDLIKQWLKQWAIQGWQDKFWTQVWQEENKIVQLNQFWTTAEPVEEKSRIWGLIQTWKDLFNMWVGFITKPRLDDWIFWVFTDNWLNKAKSEDLRYIKDYAKDSNEAYNILKKRWAITDDTKAREELDSYFWRLWKWAQKNQPDAATEKNIIEKYQEQKLAEQKSFVDLIKKDSFNLSKPYITDFAALRASTLQQDAVENLYGKWLTTVFDIKKKQEELKKEWVSSPYIDEQLAKAEKVQKSTINRIGEIARMQAKYGWDIETNQAAVLKDIQSKWFDSINQYVMQDVVNEPWVNANLQHLDAIKTIWAKANVEYQKLKKKDSWWDYITTAYNLIDSWLVEPATLLFTSVLSSAQRWLWFEYSSSDVWSLANYQFEEKWVWAYKKMLNDITSALPEAWAIIAAEVWTNAAIWWAIWAWAWLVTSAWVLSAPLWVAWTIAWAVVGSVKALSKIWKLVKWVSYLEKAEDVIRATGIAWDLAVTWGYWFKMLKWLWVTTENALKWERALQNAVYTIWNRVPKEVAMWMVWNSFDPESWTQMQEHFALLDIWFWASSWIFRQFDLLPSSVSNFFWAWVVKKMNDVFNTPEAWQAYMDALLKTASDAWVTRYWQWFTSVEARLFTATYTPLLEATGKYLDMIRSWDLPIDHPLRSMDEAQFNNEVKKSYARWYLRDLYVKREWQLTDADRMLMWNLQKIVKDPNINVADAVKLSYNIPWKIELAWFTSNIRIQADNMLNQLDFNYWKTVDEVFDIEWWKPDNILTIEDLNKVARNTENKNLYKNLFWKVNWEFVFNAEYFKEVDDWFELTAKWYEYLWIIDQRKAVDKIIASDDTLSVTDAIRKSMERTKDVVPEEQLALLERNNTIDKLISFFWC